MENIKLLLKDKPSDKILDVCTGVGNFIYLLKESLSGYDSIIGIDNLDKVVDMAKKQNKDPKVSFKVMDCTKMDFENNTFDMTCLSNSLHHLENIKSSVDELKRVTKKDGYILIGEMFKDNQSLPQMTHVIFHHWSAHIGRLRGSIHNETYNKDEIVDIIKSNNLEIVDDTQCIFPADTSDESKKTLCSQVDQILNDVRDSISSHEDYPMLCQQAESLKKHIQEHGFQNATCYLALCKKK